MAATQYVPGGEKQKLTTPAQIQKAVNDIMGYVDARLVTSRTETLAADISRVVITLQGPYALDVKLESAAKEYTKKKEDEYQKNGKKFFNGLVAVTDGKVELDARWAVVKAYALPFWTWEFLKDKNEDKQGIATPDLKALSAAAFVVTSDGKIPTYLRGPQTTHAESMLSTPSGYLLYTSLEAFHAPKSGKPSADPVMDAAREIIASDLPLGVKLSGGIPVAIILDKQAADGNIQVLYKFQADKDWDWMEAHWETAPKAYKVAKKADGAFELLPLPAELGRMGKYLLSHADDCTPHLSAGIIAYAMERAGNDVLKVDENIVRAIESGRAFRESMKH